MKFVSYNIQYSKGTDGAHDLSRTAQALHGADIIGLQEVTRNMPGVPDQDQPARLSELLPEYFISFGTVVDIAIESSIRNGCATSRRLHFGNMILSRWPILSTRNFLLPWSGLVEHQDMQNAVLEAMIDSPNGLIRVYVTHLNYRRSSIRRQQLEWLVAKLFSITTEGIGISGQDFGADILNNGQGIPIPRAPENFIVMGDFNLTPNCAEYVIIAGEEDFHYGRMIARDHWVDTWTRAGHDESNSATWFDNGSKTGIRLDYGFVSPDLAAKVKSARIDHNCVASDHLPYWFELDL